MPEAHAQSAAEAVMSGQAWRDFCARLADAGEAVLQRSDAGTGLFDRTEGFRYLTRLLRVGLVQNLEAADPDFPFFYRPCDEVTKYGGDNPDNVYWSAMVRGTHDYRITGERGTMHYWSIGSKAFRMELDGTIVSTGELTGEDIAWGPGGAFEIICSSKPQPGRNWLPMAPDTNFLLMRQTYLDRTVERPGRFHIERIEAPGAPAPLNAEALAGALARTVDFVRGNAVKFADFIAPVMPHINVMPDIPQDYFFKAGGDPLIAYRVGRYQIAPDEAWVIEVAPPACQYWNFSLYNCWLESFDYAHRPVTLNEHSARRNADGGVTVVVAERDPGVGNWMDSAGHLDGLGLFRWLGADPARLPDPVCRVVKLAELGRPG